MSGSLTSLRRCCAIGYLVLITLSASSARSAEYPVDFFEKKIRPVLVENCYKCHSASAEKLKGGLWLDTREGMLKGGESGKPAITPGDAEASLLIEAIRYQNEDLQMPPKKRLTPHQVEDFVQWINAGALDPRTNGALAVTSRAANHWAFKPPQMQTLPAVPHKDWAKTPIDQFVLAKMEKHGLVPAPPAERRTLLRRASIDLIGLPPSNADLDAFLKDKSPEAFPRAVDRLLSSPQYGERWGRHWLDVARYSDTKGYVYDREEKRFVHSHVYRDWVIHAFNDDMPYDRFLALQIAADQMIGPTNKTDLAAMGFLTIGRRFLGVMHDIIDDRIDVLGRATMGLTISCARCHDHKFDPIPTRDYYSLYGVFSSCNEETISLIDNPQPTEAYEAYEKELNARVGKLNKTFHAKRNEFTDRLRAKAADYIFAVLDVAKLPTEEFYTISGPDDLNPVIVRQWEAYLFKSARDSHPVFAPWHAYRALPEKDFATRAQKVRFESGLNPLVRELFATNAPSSMRDVAQRYGVLFNRVDRDWRALVKVAGSNAGPARLDDSAEEQIRQVLYGPDSPATIPDGAIVDIEWFFDENGRVELAKLQAEIDRWLLKAPGAPPHAVVLADRPVPRNPRVFLRGNPANKGEEVPRQFLEVVAGPDRKPFQHGSGRLELARAIASRDNPLTARVMVNRIWMQHFGAGLVKTPSDFGTRCEPPTHPELLDWLALRFMDDGWSIKKLHRLIMLSAVYQQGPGETASIEADPENRWLARMPPRRLDFEAMRDTMLWATGELDPTIGGKGVELFKKPSSGRRSVYGFIDRQFVPGVLRVFDFANPDIHIPQRPDTTVPQQALFFMNSPFVVERARALVQKQDSEGRVPEQKVLSSLKPEERVQRLYRAVYQREPTRGQIKAALQFIANAATTEPSPPPKPVVSPWQYGWGEYDSSIQRVKNFQPLPYFTGEAWQGGANWPDEKLGWVQLTAEGGHAGNDLQHAAIRRWVAPRDCIVSVTGTLRHENKEGDGIQGRIVSGRAGSLGDWTVHENKAEIKLENVELKKGDTLDFVVDYRANLNSDMFKWAPVIKATESQPSEWSAKKDFAGRPVPPPRPLTPWEQYAQVLLLSNEFLFVD